jgi:5-methylcytosine-specific restriction endonuclease McrA
MAICKKCSASFPLRVVIDGKERLLAKRKYCLECSPFGQHNTKQIHIATERSPERKCKECSRVFPWAKAAGHRGELCNTCVQRKRRKLFSALIDEQMGTKCWICGYDRSRSAMHLHHVDPASKSFAVGGSEGRSFEKVKAELAKCALLCSNCHCEVHEGITPCPPAFKDRKADS